MEFIIKRKNADDELCHHKYIEKKKVNGKWRYYYDRDSFYSRNKKDAELQEINDDISALKSKKHVTVYDESAIEQYEKLKKLKEDEIAKGEAWYQEYLSGDGSINKGTTYKEFEKASNRYNRKKNWYKIQSLVNRWGIDLQNDY